MGTLVGLCENISPHYQNYNCITHTFVPRFQPGILHARAVKGAFLYKGMSYLFSFA